MPISFCTLVSVLIYARSQRRLTYYWRLIAGLLVMSLIYVLQFLGLVMHVKATNLKFSFESLLMSSIENNTWPYSVLPTLMYCWQHFEVLASLQRSKNALWYFKQTFLLAICLSVVLFTLLY
jgi:hypothetical protein